MPQKTSLKPGQVWRWSLSVGDGMWFAWIVTLEARMSAAALATVTVRRHDTFIVVTTHDDGPCEYEHSDIPSEAKKWFTALLHGTLVWMNADWMISGTPVADLVIDV